MAIWNRLGGRIGRRALLLGAAVLAPRALLGQPTGGAVAPPACRTEPGIAAGFWGQVEVNGSLTTATTSGKAFGGDVLLEYWRNPDACGWRRQRTQVSALVAYDEKRKLDAAPTITRKHSGYLQHLVSLPGNKLYLSGNARFLHNNSLGIELQQVYDVLLGTTFQGRPALPAPAGKPAAAPPRVELAAGPAYVSQRFLGTAPDDSFPAAAALVGASVPATFIASASRLSETVRLILPLDGQDRWQVTADVSFSIPAGSRFGITLKAFDHYVANAPAGSRKNYFALTGSVSVTL